MPVQSETMANFEDVFFTKEGEFNKMYGALRKKISTAQMAQFDKYTKPEDKVKFLLGLTEARFTVEAATCMKSLEKAMEMKELGNQFFRENNFGEAYVHYTKALQYCPVDESTPMDPSNKPYSIILANRSAAMDRAGLFAACIHDIDMALKFGYPREFWYKVYKRKGHACIKMKHYLLAKEALEISLKNVGRSDIKKEKDRDNYRTKVRKQMTIFNVTKSLYNMELYEKLSTTLAAGKTTDRGMSKKLKVQEDGDSAKLVAASDIQAEDILVSVEPYAAVVNVSGGRAGGKICPHTIEKMFHPIPCKFGSSALFSTIEARDAAARSYHQYEWSILDELTRMGFMEKVLLGLRMVTNIGPEELTKVSAHLTTKGDSGLEASLQEAVKAFRLPTDTASGEEKLVSSVLALYLTKALAASGYIKAPSKSADKLNVEETEVFNLLSKALLVADKYSSPITLTDVPESKKGMLKGDLVTSVCAYGIYPDIHNLQKCGTGEERDVISWFVDKNLVLSSYRNLAAGSAVRLFDKPVSEPTKTNLPTDMITFRCGNELCSNGFPLKENTKEKIISCPLEDCGLKTNIWERLKLIVRLKKDFASAKEEFERNEVGLARDICRDTIDEWDRICVRPYKEITQLESVYVRCLLCVIGDRERNLVQGNQLGKLINPKSKTNNMPTDNDNKDEHAKALVKK